MNSAAEKGCVLWFTGLSGAGKTTIADKLYERLKTQGIRCERLDGDLMRESLCKDLGFSKTDRDTNIERAAFVAKLLSQNGIIVLATFISPTRAQRLYVKQQVPRFVEIFVNAPLSVCEKRDVKGLYKKARLGEIELFTGVSDPYEIPEAPDLELKTDQAPIDHCVDRVLQYLWDRAAEEV